MASMKKAKASAEKGRPIMLPLNPMKPGQSRPSSNDSAVPETAPTAKIRLKAFVHRRASAVQAWSCRRIPMASATDIKSGIPTPSTAKMMWNPSEVPMIARARTTLSMACPAYLAERLRRVRGGRGGGLRSLRERHRSSDDRQVCPISEHHRSELAGGECRAQRSLVIIDHLRVLAQLRQANRMGRRDGRELAKLTGRDETRDLRILGEQHLHRGDLRCPNGRSRRERVQHGAGAGHADQDDIDDDKRQAAVGRGAQDLVDATGQREAEERHEDHAAEESDDQAKRDREDENGQRARNARGNEAGKTGVGRHDPVAQEERSLSQERPDQPLAPADQNAQADHRDDRHVNQVHTATPLSPMPRGNSTGTCRFRPRPVRRLGKQGPKGYKENDMKYVMLIVDKPGFWETLPEEKRNETFGRIGHWWADLSQKGTIVGGHQLHPANTATTIQVHGGKAEVANGPFNAKEAGGGYGILEVANLDEALAAVTRSPWDARVELRPIVEMASAETVPGAQATARR